MNQVPFLLNECAACAKELAPSAPRCVRCWTRYCNASCQLEHWSNGHKKQCKKIARGGGAEQFYVDARAADAEARAAAACDTGQATCYICRSSDGVLVRGGCACRGTAGVAHISCMVRYAESEAIEGVGGEANWTQWYACRRCDQHFSHAVQLALGWRCWKSYAWSPELNKGPIICTQNLLMTLGNALSLNDYPKEALPLLHAQMAFLERSNDVGRGCGVLDNIATCLMKLGKKDEAIATTRRAYEYITDLRGPTHERTLFIAMNLGSNLTQIGRCKEAQELFREKLPVVKRVLGVDHMLYTSGSINHVQALLHNPERTFEDLYKACDIIQEVKPIATRVFGEAHYLNERLEVLSAQCMKVLSGIKVGNHGVLISEIMEPEDKKDIFSFCRFVKAFNEPA